MKFYRCLTIGFVSICAVLSSSWLLAESITKPHTFSAGSTAVSSEVNNNFDVLYQKVNELDSKIGTSSGIPAGCIIMWSGDANTIPAGWTLCDGSNGTPDLRNKFIVGAAGEYTAGNTGGSKTKNISHTHTYSGKTSKENEDQSIEKGDNHAANDDHTHTYSGTTDAGGSTSLDILPPYYALCYIMKL